MQELMPLSTMRVGEQIRIPLFNESMRWRVETIAPDPVAILVDLTDETSTKKASVYLMEFDRNHRNVFVWLWDGKQVREYMPYTWDPHIRSAPGIMNAINIAAASHWSHTLFALTATDINEGDDGTSALRADHRFFVDWNNALVQGKNLKSIARAGYFDDYH